ncbi:MAG: hypothetical protein ABIL24_08305, partial [candidate division WOR-3 bacterium]
MMREGLKTFPQRKGERETITFRFQTCHTSEGEKFAEVSDFAVRDRIGDNPISFDYFDHGLAPLFWKTSHRKLGSDYILLLFFLLPCSHLLPAR